MFSGPNRLKTLTKSPHLAEILPPHSCSLLIANQAMSWTNPTSAPQNFANTAEQLNLLFFQTKFPIAVAALQTHLKPPESLLVLTNLLQSSKRAFHIRGTPLSPSIAGMRLPNLFLTSRTPALQKGKNSFDICFLK
jgi:hypothetical protein